MISTAPNPRQGNVRFAPDQSAEEVEQELRALVRGEGEVTVTDRSAPAPPYRSHPLIRSLESTGASHVAPKLGWTDIARFAMAGVAAANFGPGTLAQAHQRNEWTSLSALHDADTLIRRWLSTL